MTRAWPMPDPARTLHCIGDVHVGGPSRNMTARLAAVADDLTRPTVPPVAHRVQVGDLTDGATTAQDTAGLAWLAGLGGAAHPVVGNHDMWGVRTAEQAATAWGLPAKDYTVDLGYALLTAIGPDWIDPVGLTAMSYNAATLDWLDGQLAAATKPVIVAAHPPLMNTVGVGAGGDQYRSTVVDFSAQPNTDVRAVLAEHPIAKAWISGHTHSPVTAPYLVKSEPLGGHVIAAVNMSCLAYVGTDKQNWPSPLVTMFLTVTDDAFEVRFRDHGAHQWVGGSHERHRTAVVPF